MKVNVSRTEFHQNLRRDSGLHGKVNCWPYRNQAFFVNECAWKTELPHKFQWQSLAIVCQLGL